jgi:hypothetical protein
MIIFLVAQKKVAETEINRHNILCKIICVMVISLSHYGSYISSVKNAINENGRHFLNSHIISNI